jgi:hypothetical protein
MNRIRIWCPYCKNFESVWPNANNNWVTKRCGGLLRDQHQIEIVGLEGLKKVLVDGVWTVNRKIRKPPLKKVAENSK